MQLIEVNIDDVYPDENNPRKKFEGIDELAASFDLNVERPGEPFTPPILVQDGGIYRIVDGERRYRALKKRKATKFTANVCSGLDEANTLMAMLATDDKQPLDEMEKSRGVQQMLLLGVDPVKVEQAAKIKDAKRIKRALSVVDDAAEDMSLDRLLAIEEFADDEDVVELLMYCQEKDWKRLYEREVEGRKRLALIDELTDAVDAYKVPIYDEAPSDYTYEEYFVTVEGIDNFFSKANDLSIYIAVIINHVSAPYVSVYAKRSAVENEDPNKELKDRLSMVVEASEVRRVKWYGKRLEGLESGAKFLGETADLIIDKISDSYVYDHIKSFDEIAGTDFATLTVSSSLAAGFFEPATYISRIKGWLLDDIAKGKTNKYSQEVLDAYLAGFDANVADGYEPADDELELIEMIKAVEVEHD